ncbi:flippase-like domain-containing protein [Croceivirga thetidis]|uniref:Flippase-like domain-containing protein n=1 Tax=Croceivirga thetidis TaxID=2721623 RepID=A0ABX1GSH4_9FLAO|nr:flippase-like domain-containing protein [Croceivirga thetidis]
MTEKQRKRLSSVLKIIISAALLYFIFTKIEFGDVLEVLQSAKPMWLFFAVLLFVLSKILNAFRLNLYFKAIGVKLTQLSNLKLYLLGMFYNLFLPGGIGGDAYKGYLIQKQFKVKTKRVVGVLLLDRLSGMLLILIYALILGSTLDWQAFNAYRWFLPALAPIGVGIFWWINKAWFTYALKAFWGSIGYSAVLQLLQLAAVGCIMQALSVLDNESAYLFVFMISSIVSVIPMTIGGFGSREVTFLYGSLWLGLNKDISIALSLTFFTITALVSLFGMVYHFKKLRLETY